MSKPLTNERISSRNYYMMILEGGLFWIAASFIDGNAVVSVFINEATGSLQLAGLAATLRSAATIVAQFILGMYIMNVSNFGKAMHGIALGSRWVVALMAPLLLLGVTGYPAAFCAIALIFAFFFSDGLIGLFWTEIGARTVPPRQRAAVQGYQQIFGGIAGLGSAFLVKYLLDSPKLTFATRYAWIFGLCGGVYFINMFILFLIRDFPREKKTEKVRVHLVPYLRSFMVLWKADSNFRKVMFGRILYVISSMVSSLIVLFGASRGNLTPSQVSSMLYIQVIGQVLGGFAWVRVTQKWGNTALMVLSHVLPIVISCIGIAVHFAAPALGVSCFIPVALMVLLSGMNLSSWIGYTNRVIDTVQPESRTGYLVLQSLLQFPFTFASYFAGLIAEKFSFLPVFCAVVISSVLGVLLTGSLHRNAHQTVIRVETNGSDEN